MLFTIIINTHNQENFIDRCIDSCLNQDFDNALYEIIVTDTSDNKYLYQKFYNQRIKIIETSKFSDDPCINQMLSIKKATEYATGQKICLLDGDDFFSPEKLKVLHNKFSHNKKFLNQDNIVGYSEEKKCKFTINKKKFYKGNFFYKKIFNNWPEIFGTSSICISSQCLKSFFLEIDPKQWKFLAIDALLIIYFERQASLNNYGDNLTFKSFHQNNLDSTFSNKLTKKFWTRRYQQHQYYQKINKKKYLSLDSLLGKIFSYKL